MKIGAIIQARMGSSRLPGKVLLPLPFPGGPTILHHIISRVKRCESVDQVVVATSTNVENDLLVSQLSSEPTEIFRGSEDDVLSRFFEAATIYKLDHVLRLTADNPFIDPRIIAELIREHLESGAAYTKSEGLPLGMNLEIFTSAALNIANRNAYTAHDREHVTSFIRSSDQFQQKVIRYNYKNLEKLRLTVDYESDFALASLIYAACFAQDHFFGIDKIERVLADNFWLPKINERNAQLS